MQDIEIEEPGTWPGDFLKEARLNRALLLAYQRSRRHIRETNSEDRADRPDAPRNEHRSNYCRLVERLDPLLLSHRLVAYHCSRLTPEEASRIRRSGLKTLSRQLVEEKLDQCQKDGHLDATAYSYLKTSEHLATTLSPRSGRLAKAWFCPNRSTLAVYGDVHRFFRSWGGEAIYWGHETGKLAPTLALIGTPTILKCAIPFSRLKPCFGLFSERFLSQSIRDEMDDVEPPPRFDLFTSHDLLPEDILQVIDRSDPEFESLTNPTQWPRAID